MTDWSSLSEEEKCQAHGYFVGIFMNYSSAVRQEHYGAQFKRAVNIPEDNFVGILLCPGAREWRSYQTLYPSPSNSGGATNRINARLADREHLPPSWADYAPWWLVSNQDEPDMD